MQRLTSLDHHRYDAAMASPARIRRILVAALTLGLLACSSRAPAEHYRSEKGAVSVEVVARGLAHPWSLAFLPDGRMLVTERPGRMRFVDGKGRISPPLTGVPKVSARGQGGLFDVVLAPDFAKSREIFFAYAEPRGGKNGTAVARARLTDAGLQDVEVIFRQQPGWNSTAHFGGRLVFARDGTLFVTLGERNKGRALAQTLENDLGKVIRIRRDGSVPDDNPFVGRKDVRPEIWSYGHRNPQGAALDPQTGELWTHEHGPKGGDEINIARAGRNYGWPVITYGREYSGLPVGQGISDAPGMEQPIHYWVPSIAPSGMAFYTASRFPQWQGDLFVGSLKFGQLVRLELKDDQVVHEERLLDGIKQRIRDVRVGPDGFLYLLTDQNHGALLRVGLSAAGK